MAHPVRTTREWLGRFIASNRVLSGLAVRISCDEHVLIRILESDLLSRRVRQNESVFLTFRALLTDDSLLKRLLGDAQFADTILLRNEFVAYALTNHSALRHAESHPAVVNAVKSSQKVWHELAANQDFFEFATDQEQYRSHILGNDEIIAELLDNDGLVDRILNHETLLDKLFSNSQFLDRIVAQPDLSDRMVRNNALLTKLLTHGRALEKIIHDQLLLVRLLGHDLAQHTLVGDETLLAKTLSHERVFDKIVTDDRLITRILSHGLTFQKFVSDETLLSKVLGSQRAFDKILTDGPMLLRLLSHGQVFQRIVSDDTLLTKLLAHERVFDKLLADPVLLSRILNHGRAIETMAMTPAALQKLNSLDGVIHHTARSDALFQRWAAHPDIVEAFRRSPRSLRNLLNHGTAIEAVAPQQEFLALAQASDKFVHNLLRGRRMSQRLFEDSADSERVRAIQYFRETWQRIEPVVNTKRTELNELLLDTAWKLHRVKDVREALLRVITKDHVAMLAHGEMRYTDEFSLWTLIHEILLNEEYYFECGSNEPYILDCGANFGMATYYFKSLYPGARITAFEPVPALRKMAQENVKRNAFTNVEVLPYALSGDEGEATFYVSQEYPLANTLTTRRHEMGDTLSEIKVEQRRLSGYLDRPVDFLKLDIEGSEDAVLEECKDKLKRVRSLFIEYHHGAGMDPNRLVAILRILADAGFDYYLQKAFNFGEATARRPITNARSHYSLSIWGKNPNWEAES